MFNFNLSYELTIDHILVCYNDKQFNKTNQHKLNKSLVIKNEAWYNKCYYCIVNIYTRLMQLERVNSELERRGYDSLKTLCIWCEINWENSFIIVFMSKQYYIVIDNINTKLYELEWINLDLRWIFYELNKILELF
jgi:hypothetical protein